MANVKIGKAEIFDCQGEGVYKNDLAGAICNGCSNNCLLVEREICRAILKSDESQFTVRNPKQSKTYLPSSHSAIANSDFSKPSSDRYRRIWSAGLNEYSCQNPVLSLAKYRSPSSPHLGWAILSCCAFPATCLLFINDPSAHSATWRTVPVHGISG